MSQRTYRIFILEDELDRPPRNALLTTLAGHTLTTAKSFTEGKKVYKGPYDLLLLDHDMHGYFEDSRNPNTGYQFAKWLVAQIESGDSLPQVILHSQNPIGRANMKKVLLEAGFNVSECPFGPEYLKILKDQIGLKIHV